MLILYAAPKYDYGKPERGLSFEHCNFFDTLRNMGFDICYFDCMSILSERGRAGMNTRLREVVDALKPDLLFTVLATDEFGESVIRDISEHTDTTTLNWFCDDHWRFEDYSRHWAPCFNWIVTTARSALPKYEKIGYQNVIKSQWACNHFMYRNFDLPIKYDVTFIGQPHGNRRELIRALQEDGLNVRKCLSNRCQLSQAKTIEVTSGNSTITTLGICTTPSLAADNSNTLPMKGLDAWCSTYIP